MTGSEYERQVEERLERIATAMVERGGRSMWTAQAQMLLAPDEEKVIDCVEFGLRARAPDGRIYGGPFHILPAVLLLSRWGEDLPDAAIAPIKELMTKGILQRGNTENHWLMFYAGNLLAAEYWADAVVWWNGMTPQVMHAEAKRWILGMIERTARNGHHEYDSPGYQIEHMAPLIGLADGARDEQVRKQANEVLSLLVADMALEYFRGAWAGSHSREGYRQNTWTRSGPIQGLQYAYFGGIDFDPNLHCNGFICPAVVSRYRPPAIFAEMAWDRSEPHAVKKTKAPRTIFRHVDGESKPVRKYTYMSRSFALGSAQIGLPGAPAGPIDLVSWDLTWDGPKHQAKIVCNHPYRGAGRFSAFLTTLPQSSGRSVGTGKPYLQYPDRLFGASPYERLMQHEGTAVALYRIPEGDEHPFVNLFLPKGIAWVERGGWLLGDAGAFHVGVRPLGPYHWEEIIESNNSSIMVTEADLIDGWLLRIEGREVGVILDAAEVEETGDFSAFCARRQAAHLDLNGWPREGRVVVESTTGRLLEMVYDGVHRVDGVAIDYEEWPLYEAPGVRAEMNTGKMSFRHGEQALELDFEIDPEKEMIPMRVIG